jgi:hypothetical protein
MASGSGLTDSGQRVEEARTRAAEMHDFEAQQTMLRIAEMYDRMAGYAARREDTAVHWQQQVQQQHITDPLHEREKRRK